MAVVLVANLLLFVIGLQIDSLSAFLFVNQNSDSKLLTFTRASNSSGDLASRRTLPPLELLNISGLPSRQVLFRGCLSSGLTSDADRYMPVIAECPGPSTNGLLLSPF